jgi:hypothetical protein
MKEMALELLDEDSEDELKQPGEVQTSAGKISTPSAKTVQPRTKKDRARRLQHRQAEAELKARR